MPTTTKGVIIAALKIASEGSAPKPDPTGVGGSATGSTRPGNPKPGTLKIGTPNNHTPKSDILGTLRSYNAELNNPKQAVYIIEEHSEEHPKKPGKMLSKTFNKIFTKEFKLDDPDPAAP